MFEVVGERLAGVLREEDRALGAALPVHPRDASPPGNSELLNRVRLQLVEIEVDDLVAPQAGRDTIVAIARCEEVGGALGMQRDLPGQLQ